MIGLLFKFICWAFFGACWHKWSKWNGKFSFALYDYQRKQCSKCGMVKQRSIGYTSEDF